MCFSDFSLKRKHVLHILPFIVFVALFRVTSFSGQSILAYKIVAEIQYFVYVIAIFTILYRYKEIYLKNYSNADYSVYKWLFQITLLSLIGHIFVIVEQFFPYAGHTDFLFNINLIISANVLLIASFFVLKALFRPDIFIGVPSNFLRKTVPAEKKNKMVEPVNDKESTLEAKKLLDYMKEERPYLDCDLSLQKLSSQTHIPEKELSAIINHHLGTHFFDFVNAYRINDARGILKDPKQKHLTILEILYQVGFNSKSSFYTAFKKSAGQTPKQYKKEHLLKSTA